MPHAVLPLAARHGGITLQRSAQQGHELGAGRLAYPAIDHVIGDRTDIEGEDQFGKKVRASTATATNIDLLPLVLELGVDDVYRRNT